jgi:subtilisin family serine protease
VLRNRCVSLPRRNTVDLFAPGVDIANTWPGGQYARLSGTSMACPHVTGAAALLWSYVPAASAAQVWVRWHAFLLGSHLVFGRGVGWCSVAMVDAVFPR